MLLVTSAFIFLVLVISSAVLSKTIVFRYIDESVSSVPLAIFRIVYGIVMFLEVRQLLYFEHLITDPIPYRIESEVHLTYGLIVWLIALIFLILGLFTRTAAIVNYLLSLITLSIFRNFEYHADHLMIGINLLLIVAPISSTLSFDRLLQTLRYSTLRNIYKPPVLVSGLYSKIFILIAIGFVYFDSVFWKLDSSMWKNGLGMWLPASLPHIVRADISFLLDQEWLMKLLGYMTLLFEAAFIVLMWFRKLWPFLFFIGIGLHFAITVVFPIPWFGLSVAAVYLLLISPTVFNKIGERIRCQKPHLTFFYDENCLLCLRTRLIIEYFDVRDAISFKGVQSTSASYPELQGLSEEDLLSNIYSVDREGRLYQGLQTYRQVATHVWPFFPMAILLSLPGINHLAGNIYRYIASNRYLLACHAGSCPIGSPLAASTPSPGHVNPGIVGRWALVGLLTLMISSQLIVTTQSPIVQNLAESTKITGILYNVFHRPATTVISNFSKPLGGITYHGVFMDYHFHAQNHIVTVIYADKFNNEHWLPLYQQSGLVDSWNSGRIWAYWNWRVIGVQVETPKVEEGIKRITAFWAYKNGIPLEDAEFKIKVKRVEVPESYQRGFLRQQKEHPWVDAGVAKWKDGTFSATLRDIESIRVIGEQ